MFLSWRVFLSLFIVSIVSIGCHPDINIDSLPASETRPDVETQSTFKPSNKNIMRARTSPTPALRAKNARDWSFLTRLLALAESPNTAMWHYEGFVDVPGLFHAEGMTKIGNDFYVSSVEVIKEHITPDCDAGEGKAWITKFQKSDSSHAISKQVTTYGNMYHPGGIDALRYDATASPNYIYIPLATYLPGAVNEGRACNGTGLMYAVSPHLADVDNPDIIIGTIRTPFPDHLSSATIMQNPSSNQYIFSGTNWGSQDFYDWTSSHHNPLSFHADPLFSHNPQAFISFQDCQHLEDAESDTILWMLCSGPGIGSDPHSTSSTPPDVPFFFHGGIGLVRYDPTTATHSAVHNIYVPMDIYAQLGRDYKGYASLYDPSTKLYVPMAYNPFFCEKENVLNIPTAVRCYFLPIPEQANTATHQAKYYGRMYEFTLSPWVQITGDESHHCLTTTGANSITAGSCDLDTAVIWSFIPGFKNAQIKHKTTGLCLNYDFTLIGCDDNSEEQDFELVINEGLQQLQSQLTGTCVIVGESAVYMNSCGAGIQTAVSISTLAQNGVSGSR